MDLREDTTVSSDIALYGKSVDPWLLAVHPIRTSGPARVQVYRRNPDGTAASEEAPIYPFFFLADIRALRTFPRRRYQYQELAGPNAFRHLVVFERWNDYWDAIRHVQKTAQQPAESLYLINNPVQQYLMQTGRTCFKGMAFDHLHRMQLDIETYSEGVFPNPENPAHPVIVIALSDNRGWRRILHTRDQPEPDMLKALVEIIRERDPDVIEGHNIFAFDFAYLMARYARYGIPFSIGRDGSVPRTFPTSMRFAERSVDFPALHIAGRHVIDTYFLVMAFDVFKRDLPGYGLKAAARYFGLAAGDRTYIDGDDIARTWREDPDRLLQYALDDVIETERLARRLSGSTFYLTQMVPMAYDQVARTGPAAKIEALFVREYLRRKTAIPRSQWGSQTMGGYTDVFFTGVAGPIVYADVESLYPSIMLQYDIRPRSDTLQLFPELLRRLTDLRLETKRMMRDAATEAERSELDARQQSYKNLINSFYGNLGFGLAAFNDYEAADRVAAIGQQILRQIIELLVREGARVIEVDTDGVLFVPPAACRDENDERAFLERLNREMPAGIHIGYDGRFKKMLSYKKKNYALLDYDGRLTFKGSSLVSRSNERFGRRFVAEAIRLLLEGDVASLHRYYLEMRERIEQHAWDDVFDFSRTETLREPLERYLDDVAAGKRPRAAAYELALRRRDETGQPARKGDRITYYIAGTDSAAPAFETARLAAEWSPDQPDENTAYYLKRLDEFCRKFEPFFSETDFRLIFSPEDLFGFDPSGIQILSRETLPENPR